MKYGIADVDCFFRETLRKTKYDARKNRNLDFDIDVDYVLRMFFEQDGKCALTGWPMSLDRGGNYKGRMNSYVATMDRLDNQQGYVRGNIQLTCLLPNLTKGALNNKEFVELCKLVADKNCNND